ncbi:MAG TPA: hypothetical protein VKX49_02625 [Bryobacteraceae bacterium]|nr:hypothetical protein [Bryobacteraceae bacterium]
MSVPIPPEQLSRIQPVVDAVLTTLHEYTQGLTDQVGLALDYDPEAGA